MKVGNSLSSQYEIISDIRPDINYRLAESDWMNVNVGDSLYITSKRTGADAYISDKDGNRIADIVRVR